MLTIGSLFSGLGGLELGLERAGLGPVFFRPGPLPVGSSGGRRWAPWMHLSSNGPSCLSESSAMPAGWNARFQDWYGEGYVRAVAGAAGLSAGPPGADDVFGVDLQVVDPSEDVTHYPALLWIQLKTVRKSSVRFGHREDGERFLTYDLKVKNYNKLVRRTATPFILVVLLVPEARDLWMAHVPQKTELRWGAYWVRLTGRLPSDRKNTVAVEIPLRQEFNHLQLRRLMDLTGDEGATWML